MCTGRCVLWVRIRCRVHTDLASLLAGAGHAWPELTCSVRSSGFGGIHRVVPGLGAAFRVDAVCNLFHSIRSAGPPGGNQVDGLPPASSSWSNMLGIMKMWNFQNAFRIVPSMYFISY